MDARGRQCEAIYRENEQSGWGDSFESMIA